MTKNRLYDDDGAGILLSFLGDKLDPAPLISLIPMTISRAKKKGDPVVRTTNVNVARAKIGLCSFTSAGKGLPGNGNAHLGFVLDIVEERIAAIREIVAAQSLTWRATFFEGDAPDQHFDALNPDLLRRAADLGMKVGVKGYESVTFVMDDQMSFPSNVTDPPPTGDT